MDSSEYQRRVDLVLLADHQLRNRLEGVYTAMRLVRDMGLDTGELKRLIAEAEAIEGELETRREETVQF